MTPNIWPWRDSLRRKAERVARDALGKANWALPRPLIRTIWGHHAFWFGLLLAGLAVGEYFRPWAAQVTPRAVLPFMQLLAVLPVTLVGALVPFMVLLAQLRGGREMALTRRERAWRPLRAVLFYAGALLLVVTLTGGLFGATVTGSEVTLPTTARVALVLIGAIFVMSLVLGTRFVLVAINMLAPEFVFEEARTTLLRSVYRSLFTEARSRAMRRLFAKVVSEHDADETWRAMPHLPAVRADRDGVLVDVKVRLLKRTLQSLTMTIAVSHGKPRRALFKVMPGGDVERNNELVYLAPDEPKVEDKARRLEKALVVAPEPAEDRSRLREALEDFKQIGIAAVEVGHQPQLRRAIGVYEDLLRTYMATGLRFRDSEARDFLARWGFLLLLQGDLDDLAAHACRSRDHHFVGHVLYEYRRLLTAALEERDLLVFNTVLEVFPRAYWRAVEAGSEFGKGRAQSHLSDFSDWTLLREADRNPQEAVELIPFITAVRDTLAGMVKECIDAGDVAGFESTLEALVAQFAHFHPEWQEQYLIEGGSDAGRAAKEVANSLADHHAFSTRVLYNAFSYLVERFERDLVPAAVAKGMAAEIQKRLGSAGDLMNWAMRSWAGEDRVHWEVVPKTRGVWGEDPSRRTRRVVVLRGLRLQQAAEEPLPLGPSEFIKHQKDQLIAEGQQVLGEHDRWEWLLPGLRKEHVDRLSDAFASSAADYDRSVEEGIIAAPLAESRIEDFRQAILKAYGDGGAVRELLSEVGHVRSAGEEDVPEFPCLQHRGPKEAFIEQERISYRGWGEQYGRALQDVETELFVRTLKSHAGSTRVVSQETGIVEMLRLAIGALPVSPGRRLVLLVHRRAGIQMELEKAPGFTPAWQREGRRLREAIGHLDDLAILGSDKLGEDEVLGVDVSRACRMEERDRLPTIEVRGLTASEVKRLEESGKEDPRELAKQVIVRVERHLRFVVEDAGGIVAVRRSRDAGASPKCE